MTIRSTPAAATTITPNDLLTHVSGTGAIATITVPKSLITGPFEGYLYLIADGAWTTVTTGNIANAITAVVGQAYIAIWEGAKWYLK